MTAGFLDTNVLIYAFSSDPRALKAEELLSGKFVTSVQGLNEFANVARRKLGMSWEEVRLALASIRTLAASVQPLTLETHDMALDLVQRYGVSLFDGLMLAAALQADCSTFWSEDMQDGMVIEQQLTVTNPFAER